MDGAALIVCGSDCFFVLSDSYRQNIRVERLQGGCVEFGWVGLLVLWEFVKFEFCQWGLDSESGRGAGVNHRGSQRFNSATPAHRHGSHVVPAPSHVVR